ncbi:MAG: chalcone isomerase family protein [Marinobacter sp.]|uniref:chalcone isomerase family protein n=1 Tax=Marinobacter sp. TaxID=50741 RepID=UPI001B7921CF|nr:chalcone isomerase family protein [Marinobacter sp.]MBQ0745160.1 chalcone isomerase family protein [Marinobacter sp.]MBQ0814186.1 chalcone isomerase family protein [Marinobacter sp.]|tara:strand:+ start:14759 stop:15334 length:576 start_codon:yes stop_codon:yes gene_type:complete
MKKAYLTGIACLMLAATLSAPALALTVGGVDVPDTYTANSTELQLNGAGTRSKFFIDLYVGSLYVPKAQHDGNAVVDADEPQAITLHITSDMITSDRMTEATMEGFEASTGGDMAPIQSEIDQFMSVFKEEIKEGDVFDLVYVPGEGVKVFKNSEQKGTVGDLEFKKALFGIWLSDEPAQKSLKKKMLGQG